MENNFIRESLEAFYGSTREAHLILKENTQKIADRKEEILQLLDKAFNDNYDIPKGEGFLYRALEEAVLFVNHQIEEWKNEITSMIRKSEFVNKHEESLLVIVFAGVKAGKSTLGNFVSGYYLAGSEFEDLHHPLKYHIEDFSKASSESRSSIERDMPFFEDQIEATSTIQHYTLREGLTWVDTPGLHSLTAEHGDLAREYVQFADLVLYLTPSSAPGKLDEQIELNKLFIQKKPVMLVISRSDEVKPVIGLVAKAVADRNKQEEYVRSELSKMNGLIENDTVVSISTKLAIKAVETNNEELYKASNMGIFLNQVSRILSKDTVNLKMKRPKSEVNNTINRLILQNYVGHNQNVPMLGKEIAKYKDELRGLYDRKKELKQTIVQDIKSYLPTQLSLTLRSLRDSKELNDRSKVSEIVNQLYNETCISHCLTRFKSEFKMNKIQLPNLSSSLVKTNDIGKYEVAKQKLEYQELVERTPKNFWEKVEKFFDEDKKFYQQVTRTEYLEMGDNYAQYVERLWESTEKMLDEFVDVVVEQIYTCCLDPLSNYYERIQKNISCLTDDLSRLKFEEV